MNVPPGTHTIPSTGGAVGPVTVVPLTWSGYLLGDAPARAPAIGDLLAVALDLVLVADYVALGGQVP